MITRRRICGGEWRIPGHYVLVCLAELSLSSLTYRQLALYCSLWFPLGLYVPYKPPWCPICHVCFIWVLLVPGGPLCHSLMPYDPLWPDMPPFGLSWPPMRPQLALLGPFEPCIGPNGPCTLWALQNHSSLL